MIDPNKYIVFKREDWEGYLEQCTDGCDLPAIEDARVIRDQDIFASSAYYAYANHIRGTVEVLKAVIDGDPTSMTASYVDDVVDHLTEIADYFMNAAEVAEANPNRKLPT